MYNWLVCSFFAYVELICLFYIFFLRIFYLNLFLTFIIFAKRPNIFQYERFKL